MSATKWTLDRLKRCSAGIELDLAPRSSGSASNEIELPPRMCHELICLYYLQISSIRNRRNARKKPELEIRRMG